MVSRLLWIAAAALIVAPAFPSGARAAPETAEKIVIGSKAFPESWILGEALANAARDAGADAVHRDNLGGTQIVYSALERGSIDLYVEYSGTISDVILKRTDHPDLDEMRRALAPRGISVSAPLGFNNGYALAVTRATSDELNLRRISDLLRLPELKIGLSHEFVGRDDGWSGLAAHYGLGSRPVRGMQHELAYQALEARQIDLVDIYTTDAQIEKLGLVLLEDDRRFFPRYDAVILYRTELRERAPAALEAALDLEGKLDEAQMIAANSRVGIQKWSAADAARELVSGARAAGTARAGSGWATVAREVARDTAAHLDLVARSLLLAIVAGIPLGVLASRSRRLAPAILGVTGVVQTIPSLALLAFFIPVMGIGRAPALAALFLYSLLPIVRNTCTGLTTIAPQLSEAAAAIGLSPIFRLFRVELPLASPSISAGIKTSAVINVGTATLAAFIGAGGLGEPILRGISLLDSGLILRGAVPAALLALLAQGLFDLLDHWLVPRGLRLKSESKS